MNLVFGRKLVDGADREFCNLYDDDNEKLYLGCIERPPRHRHWNMNDELCLVFPLLPRQSNYENINNLKRQLKRESEKLTSRQAQVRVQGYEHFLSERPNDRGLDRYRTSEMWAEIVHRIRRDLPNVSFPKEADEIEKLIAECPPLPPNKRDKNDSR